MHYMQHTYRLKLNLVKHQIICKPDDWQHPHLGQLAITCSIHDTAFRFARQLIKRQLHRIEHSLRCRRIGARD